MPDAILTINGAHYGGWETVQVTRSIEQIAGTFELSVSEKWPGQPTARPIRPGDTCTLKLGGELLITGYVDDVEPSFDAQQHTVTIKGRDRTGDLVDCSAAIPPAEYTNIGLLALAVKLCAPFGIKVDSDTDLGGPFNRHEIQPGESVFETLERAARQRAVLLIADTAGGLLFTRAGDIHSGAALIEGENIIKASAVLSHRDRFSQYIARGQRNGTDDWAEEKAARPKAISDDSGVRRYRLLNIHAEDLADGVSLKDRALWERNVRIGRGQRADITVQGWQFNNRLWPINELVKIDSPSLGIHGDLLIVATTFILNESGTTTTISAAPPQAYERIEEAPDESSITHGASL